MGKWISTATVQAPTRPDIRVPRLPLVYLDPHPVCPVGLFLKGKLVEQAIPLADKTGLGPVTDILFNFSSTNLYRKAWFSASTSDPVWVTFMAAVQFSFLRRVRPLSLTLPFSG